VVPERDRSSLLLPQKASGNAAALAKWSFDASTIGRDVDMEGHARTHLHAAHACTRAHTDIWSRTWLHVRRLTCGADGCTSSIYIGDEYNYVYKLMLGVGNAAAAVAVEWDVRSIVGNVGADKGIEALACAAMCLFFLGSICMTVTKLSARSTSRRAARLHDAAHSVHDAHS
jgi:hypothetical protein